jgi:hypothetical protein
MSVVGEKVEHVSVFLFFGLAEERRAERAEQNVFPGKF